jgi:hypothetical protein
MIIGISQHTESENLNSAFGLTIACEETFGRYTVCGDERIIMKQELHVRVVRL